MGATVTFMKDGERNISKPEVLVRDGMVYLSKDSNDHKSVKIEVYYEGQDLAYSERIKKGQKVNRVYDFSSSKKGNYVIVMSSEGRTFTNKVLI
jgi:allophanate hydrolase subunit 1